VTVGAATASVRARIGYIPRGVTLQGRRARAQYHIVPDRAATVAGDCFGAGEPLCGVTGEIFDPPVGLFPAEVSCESCLMVAGRHGVKVPGGEPGAGKTTLLDHRGGGR
jgi:hypothetical protein